MGTLKAPAVAMEGLNVAFEVKFVGVYARAVSGGTDVFRKFHHQQIIVKTKRKVTDY